ncbi:MAG TPA: helicase C-terminal domain-containing protein, partial [Mycobacteriales bacterium]|nr:helicase C-terminal domain-containing protein [Mycobacteriales bacterium]
LLEAPTYDALADMAGVPAPAVRAGLDRLRDLALIWGQDDDLRVVGPVREIALQAPAQLGRPAAVCFAHQPKARIAEVAAAIGASPDLEGIVAVLSDPARVTALVAEAGEGAARIAATLAAGPPFGQITDAARRLPAGPDSSPVTSLIARGLLVAVNDTTVELPREVGLALRGNRPLGVLTPEAPPLGATALPAGTVDRAAAQAAAQAVHRVEMLLALWEHDPPAVLRTGGLGVRDLRRTARALETDDAEAALVIEVAIAAGLLDQTAAFDVEWVPTTASDGWLAQPTERRWVTLAAAWLGLARLPGLVGDRDERGKVLAALSPELARPAAVAERRFLLDLLAEAPPGHAVDAARATALAIWRGPRRGGRHRDRFIGWTLLEAERLGLCGRGGLSTAGRHLLAGDETAAARAVASLLPDPLDHVLVQPDLTVVAPGPLERDLQREMALVADVESTGGATVYRVSESSVRRALDAGRSVSDLHELFRTRSKTPVPQALTYLLDDAARKHGRMRVGAAASYLRCDDEALLTEVLAHKRAKALRLRRLAPTVLTSAVPVEELLVALRGLGFAPAAETEDGGLVLGGRQGRRTPLRPRPVPPSDHRLAPEQASLAVTALRAGDIASRASRRAPVSTTRTSSADTLALLQAAARDGRQVWLGYVDAQGRATSRVVAPHSVEGGWVAAYDHLRQQERTFAVHRITGIADVEDDALDQQVGSGR